MNVKVKKDERFKLKLRWREPNTNHPEPHAKSQSCKNEDATIW